MIPYIIKSVLCLAMLLAFYHLVLERERMHTFNRFYLLGSAIVSLLTPLYIIYEKVAYVATPVIIPPITEMPSTEISVEKAVDFTPYIIGFYIFISLLLLIRFGRNLWQITQIIRQNEHIPLNNATLILIEKQVITHSFLNYIFVNKSDYLSQKITDEMLTHEMTHIRQKHSIDILFVEILQIIFWVNPSLIFLKKAIKLNHEFLADQKVIKTYKNISKYQHLLLGTSTYKHKYHLASDLNYLLTKKRLKMMRKTSSKTVILIKKLAVLPLLISAVFLFAQRVEAQEKPSQEKKPLTVVDGKIIPNALSKQIDPENIESINVLKDKSATKIYGEKGKNGVIEITTKNKVKTGFKTVNSENVYFVKKKGNTTYYNRFGQEIEIKNNKVVILEKDKIVPDNTIRLKGTSNNDKIISGVVRDKSGVLSKVYVIIKNTSKGTVTDLKGRYRIKAKKGDILVFSYKGKKTIERKVEDTSTVFNVTLEDKVISNKKTISPPPPLKQKKASPPPPPLPPKVVIEKMIKEKVLVILDGKIIPSEKLNKILPYSIKNMSVLKGKAAIEKYGEKGKNGVIIITSKNKSKNTVSSNEKESVKNNNYDKTALTVVRGRVFENDISQKSNPQKIAVFKENSNSKTKVYGERDKNGESYVSIVKSHRNGDWKTINGEKIYSVKENGNTIYYNKRGHEVKIKNNKVIVLDTPSSKEDNNDLKIVENFVGHKKSSLLTKEQLSNFEKNPPLLVVDNKIISHKNLNKISPNSIKDITILKGEKALKIYGDKGKNGVIIVTSKK